MVKSLLLVFLGGGVGSMLRFGISNFVQSELPLGTMMANLLGSLLIGIFLGLFEKEIISQTLLLLFVVGFCGGFTTFSSFAAENLKLIQDGNIGLFLTYAVSSILLGMVMVYAGFKLVKWV